jgi:hypothetical protein
MELGNISEGFQEECGLTLDQWQRVPVSWKGAISEAEIENGLRNP